MGDTPYRERTGVRPGELSRTMHRPRLASGMERS